MRFVVLGARGQLAQELILRLPGEVVALDRARADLTHFTQLRLLLNTLRPDVLINCAAYNFVDQAEFFPELAFTVNALSVRDLATWCALQGVLLVHFSTDHVFGLDQERQTPYGEADLPGPVGVYGQSKLIGEHLIRTHCSRHLIIRTCGLYGLRGKGGKGNFVEAMLSRANARRPVRVVADQICTPTAAADLADAVVDLLQQRRNGLYHRTNAGLCSWYEFASAIFEQAGLSVDLEPISTKEFGAPALRPGYSVLASRLPPLRPWRESLATYLEQRLGEKQVAEVA